MNNKGFSIIELLAVLAIISIVALIGIIAVNKTNNDIEEQLLEDKKNIILNGAELYGQDNQNLLIEECVIEGNTTNCLNTTLNEINDNGKYVEENDTCINSSNEEYLCVLNHITEEDMGTIEIIIYLDNYRVNAIFK